jgi:hypothetical protein
MKERNLAALKSVPKFGMTGRSSGPLELDKYLIGHHLNAARIGAVDPPRPDPRQGARRRSRPFHGVAYQPSGNGMSGQSVFSALSFAAEAPQ